MTLISSFDNLQDASTPTKGSFPSIMYFPSVIFQANHLNKHGKEYIKSFHTIEPLTINLTIVFVI